MYEWLLAVHVLAAGLWFGSGVAIMVIGRRMLASGPRDFGVFGVPAGWWAGRAHPGAGLVLLLTGPGMAADADIGFGEPWITIALVGLFVLFAIGGALIGPTSVKLRKAVESGDDAAVPVLGKRLLTLSAIEMTILALVIVDMVVKPG